MTPLLPTPDHYLHNLIAMTSSEAKRLWRRSIKEYFDKTCAYCGETYELNELTLDQCAILAVTAEVTHIISYAPAYVAIRKKEVPIGNYFLSQFNNEIRNKIINDHITLTY